MECFPTSPYSHIQITMLAFEMDRVFEVNIVTFLFCCFSFSCKETSSWFKFVMHILAAKPGHFSKISNSRQMFYLEMSRSLRVLALSSSP